jgi:hypothetical protein
MRIMSTNNKLSAIEQRDLNQHIVGPAVAS